MPPPRYKDFSLAEWLHYLENRYQHEIQLGLSRIEQVAAALDLLKPQATVITIAGTNGKGSTVAALEAIYLAAGYQVGSYTSPHLLCFTERIKVNRQAIQAEQLCQAFSMIEESRQTIPLTYFEMATLAALWYFKQYSLDLIILEVGVGGRLDATNIIDNDLAIITTIDYDHQDLLGPTLEAIGREKAGILRRNKPLIFADDDPPQSVISHAKDLQVPMLIAGRDYQCKVFDKALEIVFKKKSIHLPRPHLHPNSVAAAIIASICLQPTLPIQDKHWQQGLQSAFIEGRLQQVKGRVTHLFDVAHNPQAAEYLADFIKKLGVKGSIHAVFSALKDKDINGLISPLVSLIKHWYVAKLDVKRAASEEQLTTALEAYGMMVSSYAHPLLAYQAACNQVAQNDLIVVYGSFIIVGQVFATTKEKL